MAQMRGEGTLTATASVGYPNGLTWMHQWFKTSRYLGRLRQVYAGEPLNNIDLTAIVDAFMISCAHLWDAFKNDAGLPNIKKSNVDAAMKADGSLRLCRDFANTSKHLKRRGDSDVEATVVEAGSRGTGNFVTIGYGPGTNPRASSVDALDLAESAYTAWRSFMAAHGIEDPTHVTDALLNPVEP